ncbi:MAG: hypothetical protein M5R42_18360 [Rhodocyclaceae bacterium]|nr:hypothetical protein [Rhodocyclaceae bacterium]
MNHPLIALALTLGAALPPSPTRSSAPTCFCRAGRHLSSEVGLKYTYTGYCGNDAHMYAKDESCADYQSYRRLKNVALWESADGAFPGLHLLRPAGGRAEESQARIHRRPETRQADPSPAATPKASSSPTAPRRNAGRRATAPAPPTRLHARRTATDAAQARQACHLALCTYTVHVRHYRLEHPWQRQSNASWCRPRPRTRRPSLRANTRSLHL